MVLVIVLLIIAQSCAEPSPEPRPTPFPVTATPTATSTPTPRLGHADAGDLLARSEGRPVKVITPTPTATPTSVPPGRVVTWSIQPQYTPGLSEAEMVDVLRSAGWPEDVIPYALTVTWCESRWQPGAIGDYGASLGIFQIQPQWHTWRLNAVGGGDWLDAVTNARVALHLWQTNGWQPWTCAR